MNFKKRKGGHNQREGDKGVTEEAKMNFFKNNQRHIESNLSAKRSEISVCPHSTSIHILN